MVKMSDSACPECILSKTSDSACLGTVQSNLLKLKQIENCDGTFSKHDREEKEEEEEW
jgi:hypothetical protein